MHIISFRKIREYFNDEPNARVALQDWYKRTKKAEWDNFSELKKSFNSVDAVGNSRYVFNIKGTHYWMVVKVMFTVKRVYIRWIGSHTEYDKIKNIEKL